MIQLLAGRAPTPRVALGALLAAALAFALACGSDDGSQPGETTDAVGRRRDHHPGHAHRYPGRRDHRGDPGRSDGPQRDVRASRRRGGRGRVR